MIFLAQFVVGMNASTNNYLLQKAQRGTFTTNLSGQNIQTEIYSPDQLTLNQSSSNYEACHGYFCLGKIVGYITTRVPLVQGSIIRVDCPQKLVPVMVKNKIYCLPTQQVRAYIFGEQEFLYIILIILLLIFFWRKRKKKKEEEEYAFQKQEAKNIS